MPRALSLCRASIAAACLIAACHSGEERILLRVGGNPMEPLRDAGDANDGDPGSVGPTDLLPDADAGDAEAGPGSVVSSNCGNGDLDTAEGEQCDDGNDQHSDGCDNDCRPTRITQVGIGEGFLCALSSGGGVKCWGRDLNGSLGRAGTGSDVTHPLTIPILDFGTTRRVVQIAVGNAHACALFEGGKARCWGRNAEGQLGIGSRLDYGDDGSESLAALADLPLNDIQSLSAGPYTTCAVTGAEGGESVYCWGSNSQGELGIGSTSSRTEPDLDRPTALFAKATSVHVGDHMVCARLDSGAVRCWGGHDHGALGVGPIDFNIGDGLGDGSGLGEFPNSAAYNVQGLPDDITALGGSHLTYCAVSQGSLYCWGKNDLGQAGYPVDHHGMEIWQTPRAVDLGNVVLTQASVAASHGCVVDEAGIVRCWGHSSEGALGYRGIDSVGANRDPATDYLRHRYIVEEDAGALDEPNATDAGSFADAGAASDAGVAPADAGVAVDGGPGPCDCPLPLGAVDLGDFDDDPGVDRVATVVTGFTASCAIMETGGLRCWGDNGLGRLGYGPTLTEIGFSQTPAEVYEDHGYADVPVFGQ